MIGFAVASLRPVEVGELLEAKPDRPPAYVEPDDRKPTQTGFQGIVFGAIVGEGNWFHSTGIGESGIPAKELRKARRAMYWPVGK